MVSTMVRLAYSSINRKGDTMTGEEIKEKYSDDELLGLGDMSLVYRYVV